jgi:hypothetical protein
MSSRNILGRPPADWELGIRQLGKAGFTEVSPHAVTSFVGAPRAVLYPLPTSAPGHAGDSQSRAPVLFATAKPLGDKHRRWPHRWTAKGRLTRLRRYPLLVVDDSCIPFAAAVKGSISLAVDSSMSG